MDWPVDVLYNIYIQAAPQYCNKLFLLHFQVFGVLKKHQVCTAACPQVQCKAFMKHQEAFQILTPKDLMIASGKEMMNAMFKYAAKSKESAL
jgi:hypothetical protein